MGWYAKQKARHEAKQADYPGHGPADESWDALRVRVQAEQAAKQAEQAEQAAKHPRRQFAKGEQQMTQIICPQCQVAGQVSTKRIKEKVGVSGGKATAAVVTRGVSLLATGLSRKKDVTRAHCANCGSDWDF